MQVFEDAQHRFAASELGQLIDQDVDGFLFLNLRRVGEWRIAPVGRDRQQRGDQTHGSWRRLFLGLPACPRR